jgi:hypothetical protein
MITPGARVTINVAGLPPAVRNRLPAEAAGTVQRITWNQVYIVTLADRGEPLLLDCCDIALITPETNNGPR